MGPGQRGRHLGRRRRARVGIGATVALCSLLGQVGVPVGGAGAAPRGARAQEAATTLVRVDQSGYPQSAVKVAFVMSTAALSGSAAVTDSAGTPVDTVALGPDVGAWNRTFKYVYKVNFSGVTADGTYTVSAAGTSSPKFPIAPATIVYSQDLANSLYFYENERDGPDYIPTALRTAPGHLNDEHATVYKTPSVNANGNFKGDLTSLGKTIDVAGGWWDAGDYLKFVETTSYVVALMLEGVKTFPDEDGSGFGRLQLHRRSGVRAGLADGDVETADQDPLLPGRHRCR